MQALEELRNQIKTVEDMQSVVSTMKTLAAARIRQFEAAADATRSYDETVQMGLQILLQTQPNQPHGTEGSLLRLFDRSTDEINKTSTANSNQQTRTGLLLLGTDQGFCGRFNETVFESATSSLPKTGDAAAGHQPLILAVGSRLSRMLQSGGLSVESSISVPGSVSKILSTVTKMLVAVESWMQEFGTTDIVLIYNRRRTASAFEVKRIQLLPISSEYLQRISKRSWQSRSLPVCSIPPKQLLPQVIQQHLFVQLFRAVAESLASENASRIAAMQQAETNIARRLEGLSTRFNQSRQRAITEELMDIISGFEAT